MEAIRPEAEVPLVGCPRTMADLGMTPIFLKDHLLRTFYFEPVQTGFDLAKKTCIPLSIVDRLINELRNDSLLEVRGGAGERKMSFKVTLTEKGRARGAELVSVSSYAGAVPVPLEDYRRVVQAQSMLNAPVNRQDLDDAFTHLVLSEDLLSQLGPAVNSGQSIFLYGPPGNGKTTIAEAIACISGEGIMIPYALEVDGQIIKVYDPVNHTRLDSDEEDIEEIGGPDRRWVRCARPAMVAGGELTLGMLDLAFDRLSGYYEAPLQMKANGGVLVIDDFGRQSVSPRELLNRWIIPLEKRMDFFPLHTGKIFEAPFDVLIIFATNLEPADLVDEAFLRRIQYSLFVGNPTPDQYVLIFRSICEGHGIQVADEDIAYLMDQVYGPMGRQMRGCHPRDIVNHVIDICKYNGQQPHIDRELLDQACASYFIQGI